MATKKTKAAKPVPKAPANCIADARLAELKRNLRRTKTAEEEAAETVGWYGATMNASHWFNRARVKPEEAAMVLCQHDPIAIDIGRALKVTTDATTPEDLAKLIQNFEDLADVSPGHRTLVQWIAYARAKRLHYHPWVDEYVRAAGIAISSAADDAMAGPASKPLNVPTSKEAAYEPKRTESSSNGQNSGHGATAAESDTARTLSTDEVTEAFRDIGMSAVAWRVALTKNRPEWLMACRVSIGRPGAKPAQARWSPLSIAKALVTGKSRSAGTVAVSELDTAFRLRPMLVRSMRDWRSMRDDNPAWGD